MTGNDKSITCCAFIDSINELSQETFLLKRRTGSIRHFPTQFLLRFVSLPVSVRDWTAGAMALEGSSFIRRTFCWISKPRRRKNSSSRKATAANIWQLLVWLCEGKIGRISLNQRARLILCQTAPDAANGWPCALPGREETRGRTSGGARDNRIAKKPSAYKDNPNFKF